MDIEKFVADTLASIMKGVKVAQDSGPGNMKFGTSDHNKLSATIAGVMQDHNGTLYTSIDFDIAVTVSTSLDGKAQVSVVGIKIAGGAGSDHETVSRIKFSIPAKFA